MSATFLYQRHVNLGAKMTNFSGWDMPLRYSSQIQEHQAVRHSAGIFDVSHMLTVDITGADARALLRLIYSNDVDTSVHLGSALYGCMLNEQGYVIDDLICYVVNEQHYRIVVNAGRRQQDIDWITQRAEGMNLKITLQETAGIIALQGPEAMSILTAHCPDLAVANSLQTMQARFIDDVFIARSGYTGEDGVEIIGSEEAITNYWDALIDAGVQPCGLGARDSLRLEAGLCLYGHELSESITPLEAGIGWSVHWGDPHRSFIGKEALSQQKEQGRQRRLVGLVLEGKGMIRAEQEVLTADEQLLGTVTSGGFSPVMNKSIALALIAATNTDEQCLVGANNKYQKAYITRPAFVRKGKVLFNI